MQFEAEEWRAHAVQANMPIAKEIQWGRQAYAQKQVMYLERMREAFESLWGRRTNWEPPETNISAELFSSDDESDSDENTEILTSTLSDDHAVNTDA